jgi:hypothetical protein
MAGHFSPSLLYLIAVNIQVAEYLSFINLIMAYEKWIPCLAPRSDREAKNHGRFIKWIPDK